MVIAPGKTWHTCINFTALADGNVFKPQNTCAVSHNTKAGKVRDEFLMNATKLRSSNAEIAEYYQQAIADMGALRIEVDDNGHQFWMPAAGIPWFVAVFGRDSIIASLQAIAVYHEFARGTLLKLAQLQATELDPTFRILTVTKGFLLNIFSTMRIKKHFTCLLSHIIYLPSIRFLFSIRSNKCLRLINR